MQNSLAFTAIHKDDNHFQATGVSLILHPYHPNVPSAHMNIRFIQIGDKGFFGAVCDLNPTRNNMREASHPDVLLFHNNIKEYHRNGPISYKDARQACDDYFFLPHRDHGRGVGGTFYEHLEATEEARSFVCSLPQVFINSYKTIVENHASEPITEETRQEQLFWRGRYVEFVLLYDRGTRFGLETGGQVEAIFSSLPPLASFPLKGLASR